MFLGLANHVNINKTVDIDRYTLNAIITIVSQEMVIPDSSTDNFILFCFVVVFLTY